MRNRSCSLVGLLAVAGLLVASCGGVDYEPQTLDEFMGWDIFDEEAAEEAFEEANRQIDELVKACLADKGYEVPEFPKEPEIPAWGEGLTDDEFLLRYGYGFFAAMIQDHRDVLVHELALREVWVCEDDAVVSTEGVDVHEILVGCMSPMEFWMEQVGFEEFMAAEQECEEPAVLAVRGEPDTSLVPALDEAWSQIEPALEKMWEDVESDQRLIAAEAEWSACMATHGYDFDDEDDIFEYLSPMMDELEERGGLLALNAGELSVEDVQPFADIELEIAGADVACRHGLPEIREELRAEYQGKFIAENLEQLEKIRDLEHRLMEMRLEGKQPE